MKDWKETQMKCTHNFLWWFLFLSGAGTTPALIWFFLEWINTPSNSSSSDENDEYADKDDKIFDYDDDLDSDGEIYIYENFIDK